MKALIFGELGEMTRKMNKERNETDISFIFDARREKTGFWQQSE